MEANVPPTFDEDIVLSLQLLEHLDTVIYVVGPWLQLPCDVHQRDGVPRTNYGAHLHGILRYDGSHLIHLFLGFLCIVEV